MIPEGKYVEREIVLRKLDMPSEDVPTRKSMIRQMILSLGLVNPNESRTLVFDIFDVLLSNLADGLTINEIHEKLVSATKKDTSIKSVYYHIERMMSKGILIKRNGRYRLVGGRQFDSAVKDIYMRYIESTFDEISKIFRKLNNNL